MPRLNNMVRFTTWLLACLFMTAMEVSGKTSDNDQPLHIEADSVEIREQQGLSIYQGNVSIRRGTMLINGELIHVHSSQGELEKIRVEGNPARFHQLNDMDEEISAQCRQMEYEANSGRLVLNKDAILIQNKNRFSSDQIIYDTRKDIVQAGGNQQEQNPDQPQRVTITIHPEKNNEKKQAE